MNTSKKIYFLSAFVLIIGCLALNLSYSLFVQTEEKEIVSASVPSLAYNLTIEDGGQNTENTLEASVTIPNNTNKIITLKVNNTGSASINYGLTLLETLTANQKVQVVDDGDNDITGLIKGQTTQEVKLYIQNDEATALTLTFNLVANYSTLNLDYEIDSKIIRDPKYVIRVLSEAIIANAMLAAENNDEVRTQYRETPLTTPGESTILQSEQVSEKSLSIGTDEDGTTYYFRGAVSDNFVTFNNMCWRAVRILGDGSVKLILASKDGPCNETNIVAGNAFVGSEDVYYGSRYPKILTYENSEGCYSTYSSSTRPSEWGNSMSLKSALDEFYNENNFDETKLRVEATCIGISEEQHLNGITSSRERYNPLLSNQFKCGDGIARITESYVSPITIDEAIYAGVTKSSKTETYLTKNLTYSTDFESEAFFTLSVEEKMSLYLIESDGNYGSGGSASAKYYCNAIYGARPTIILKSGILSTGNGTIEDPYIVN